jgi:hypothetical protein
MALRLIECDIQARAKFVYKAQRRSTYPIGNLTNDLPKRKLGPTSSVSPEFQLSIRKIVCVTIGIKCRTQVVDECSHRLSDSVLHIQLVHGSQCRHHQCLQLRGLFHNPPPIQKPCLSCDVR